MLSASSKILFGPNLISPLVNAGNEWSLEYVITAADSYITKTETNIVSLMKVWHAAYSACNFFFITYGCQLT